MASPAKQLMLLLIGFVAVSFTNQIEAANLLTPKALNQMLTGQVVLTKYFDHSNNSHFCDSALQQRNRSCLSVADSCPTWFICNHNEPGECRCGSNYSYGIKCDEKRMVSDVLNCYCVTEVKNKLYVGLCFYNCEPSVTNKTYYHTIYHDISKFNKSELNDYMCGRFNRIGITCGECKPGLSPFVLSYNLSCVNCPNSHKNWWKFVLFGFVPLTLFYFFIVFFNVNITSSRLHGLYYSVKLGLHWHMFILCFLLPKIPQLCQKL